MILDHVIQIIKDEYSRLKNYFQRTNREMGEMMIGKGEFANPQ